MRGCFAALDSCCCAPRSGDCRRGSQSKAAGLVNHDSQEWGSFQEGDCEDAGVKLMPVVHASKRACSQCLVAISHNTG